MVEYSLHLDSIFNSLADPIRRDILRRATGAELSVSELAQWYDVTLAAVSKHLQVLEKAGLIRKERRGKQQVVHVSPAALKEAAAYLGTYEELWNQRFDKIENLLTK